MPGISETYYAKILLFGEYSVILGSRALTIPFTHFNGRLAFISDEQYTDLNYANRSNQYLKEYFSYLAEKTGNGELPSIFDLRKMEKDLGKGLFFESSIPLGYGIGSSGALVAAIYRKYSMHPETPRRSMKMESILELKKLFSAMEAYFHGTSSGMDPLICYLRFPLLIEGKHSIRVVKIPRPVEEGAGTIFLVDTHTQGKTGPLVEDFMKKYKEEPFRNLVDRELIPLNHACIDNLLEGDIESFFRHVEQLSAFQLEHFRSKIPGLFPEYWNKGLESGDFYMKLLGSGGGGYMLGFARDYRRASLALHELGLEMVPVYRTKK